MGDEEARYHKEDIDTQEAAGERVPSEVEENYRENGNCPEAINVRTVGHRHPNLLERETRLELATSTLARLRSTN